MLTAEAGRPTFFELVAAERLLPSLKAAATYSLSVSWGAALRVPHLRFALDKLKLLSLLSYHNSHNTAHMRTFFDSM